MAGTCTLYGTRQDRIIECEVFRHYELVQSIGQGGMATVYEGRDVLMDRRVAVKVTTCPDDCTSDERDQLYARMLREAQVIAALSHPSIVSIYDVGTQDDHQYLVMEYLEGVTLRRRMQDGPLTQAQTIAIVEQVAGALTAIHGAGIIHRDLKPSNIMILRDGRIKLLDFGIARRGEDDAISHVNKIVGSPAYMSPEQARAEPVTPATDVWALGVLAYEMLSGKTPFPGKAADDILHRVTHDDPPPIGGLPAGTERVLMRAMSREPGSRYPDAKEFAAQFRLSFQGSPASGTLGPRVAPKTGGEVEDATRIASATSMPVSTQPVRPASAPNSEADSSWAWLEESRRKKSRRPRRKLLAGSLVALLLAAIIVAAYQTHHRAAAVRHHSPRARVAASRRHARHGSHEQVPDSTSSPGRPTPYSASAPSQHDRSVPYAHGTGMNNTGTPAAAPVIVAAAPSPYAGAAGSSAAGGHTRGTVAGHRTAATGPTVNGSTQVSSATPQFSNGTRVSTAVRQPPVARIAQHRSAIRPGVTAYPVAAAVPMQYGRRTRSGETALMRGATAPHPYSAKPASSAPMPVTETAVPVRRRHAIAASVIAPARVARAQNQYGADSHTGENAPITAAPPPDLTDRHVSPASQSEDGRHPLLGTWHGTFGRERVVLTVNRRVGDAYLGTLNVDTTKGHAWVSVTAHVSPRTGMLTIHENRIVRTEVARPWDLGVETGGFDGRRWSGSGHDVKGRNYPFRLTR